MSRKAAAGPHRFHALFSHLFTSPLQLTSLPSALLLLFFWSIAPSSGSPQQPAAEQEVGGGLVRSGRPVSVV